MGKTIGIQKELNELGEALTVNGFEVTDILNTNKKVDAIIYFNDESNLLSENDLLDVNSAINRNGIVRINAAKTNVDKILKILNSL